MVLPGLQEEGNLRPARFPVVLFMRSPFSAHIVISHQLQYYHCELGFVLPSSVYNTRQNYYIYLHYLHQASTARTYGAFQRIVSLLTVH